MHELQAEETGTVKIRKIQTVTSTSITAVEKVSTKRGKEVEIKVNEDDDLRLSDPLLAAEQLEEWPEEKLRLGMQKEMESLKSFDVYKETTADKLSPKELKEVIKSRWVLVWKGEDVKARLVAKGFTQNVSELDLYASTPMLCSLKILLLLAQHRGWKVLF